MTTSTSSSAAIAVIEPEFSEPEKRALVRFLAGYSGMTREAYAPAPPRRVTLADYSCPADRA